MKRYLDETFPGLRDRARRMGAIIYFVDEASVRSDSHRGTTWGKIGQTPEVEDSGDRFSLKLISAVSPSGDMKFSCFEGRMNGPRFVNFLKKLHSDAGRPIIIITDGASYHTSGPVKRYAAESQEQVTIEHLPSYSPELNPDEQVWNHAKARLAKRFVANKAEFKAAILITFRVVAQTQMISLQGLAEDQVPMQKRHVIAALTTNLRQRHPADDRADGDGFLCRTRSPKPKRSRTVMHDDLLCDRGDEWAQKINGDDFGQNASDEKSSR